MHGPIQCVALGEFKMPSTLYGPRAMARQSDGITHTPIPLQFAFGLTFISLINLFTELYVCIISFAHALIGGVEPNFYTCQNMFCEL